MAQTDADTTRREFAGAVNMTAGELEEWLATDESRAVGQKDGSGESTGHASGRRIVEHMRTVHGHVRRHLAQEPANEDVETSKWRYSLMNRGHDPLKEA